jgi:hypothetical protein
MRLTWPLPALLSWALAWALFVALRGVDLSLAIGVGMAAGAALSAVGTTRWRRVFIALGFPLSLAASGLAGAMPAWGWLLPLVLLALVYPLNAWRDAPVFPTPSAAQREYPQAALHGLEWSWPLRFACAWRCRSARVRRGDIWAADWSGYDLVYVFQRPESMARAAEKATRELRPGAWLVSLEFDVPGLAATKVLEFADGRRVWLYRVPFRARR